MDYKDILRMLNEGSKELPDCKHENTILTGDSCYEGCCDVVKCLDCGARWIEEVPD